VKIKLFNECCKGDKIMRDEIGGALSMHWI
jgi:hypothetical protein